MQVNIIQVTMVAIGGLIGSVLRFVTGFYLVGRYQSAFPWGTFIVNISGSFLIGIVLGYFGKSDNVQQWFSNENWRLLLATGFCGGFTTFSTFSNESLQLIKQQQYQLFLIYFTASVFIGILATGLGYLITR